MIDVSRVAGNGCASQNGLPRCILLCCPADTLLCLPLPAPALPCPTLPNCPCVPPIRLCSFASLFNPDVNLMACLEGGHPLVVVAAGVRGIAPVRAALR